MTNPASAPDLSRRNLIQGSSLLMGNAILQAVAGFGAQLVPDRIDGLEGGLAALLNTLGHKAFPGFGGQPSTVC